MRKAGQDLSVVGTARKTGYACRRVRKLFARIFFDKIDTAIWPRRGQ